MRTKFLGSALIFSILVISGCCGTIPSNSRTNDVSIEQFDRLQEGMTYNEAVSLLGREGELQSSSSTMGYESKIYSWKNSFGSGITLMFSNEVLVSKSQIGLGSSPQKTNSQKPNLPSAPSTQTQYPDSSPQSPSIRAQLPEPSPALPSPETAPEANRCNREWFETYTADFCNALQNNDTTLCEKIGVECYAALGACQKMKIDERANCYDIGKKVSESLCPNPRQDGPDYCDDGLIESSNPKEICNNVSVIGVGYLQERAVGCYFKASFLTGDQSLCGLMDSYFGNYYGTIERCNAMFSGDAVNCESKNCKTSTRCDKVEEEMCISKIALDSKDGSICEKYGLNACYARVAISKQDETMCEAVGSTGEDKFGLRTPFSWQDECYYQIAIAKNEVSICEKIQTVYPHNSCFLQFALKENDDDKCSMMSNSHERDACFLRKWFNISRFGYIEFNQQ